jgi:hypothetical protein
MVDHILAIMVALVVLAAVEVVLVVLVLALIHQLREIVVDLVRRSMLLVVEAEQELMGKMEFHLQLNSVQAELVKEPGMMVVLPSV